MTVFTAVLAVMLAVVLTRLAIFVMAEVQAVVVTTIDVHDTLLNDYPLAGLVGADCRTGTAANRTTNDGTLAATDLMTNGSAGSTANRAADHRISVCGIRRGCQSGHCQAQRSQARECVGLGHFATSRFEDRDALNP